MRSDLVLICAALAALLSAVSAHAQVLDDPSLSIEAVVPVNTFSEPTSMAFLAPNDFLILERATGEVLRVQNGVVQSAPALTVPVNSDSERGLLGIAINTQVPPSVFLYFTEAPVLNGAPIANRVYRYTWNPALSRLVSPTPILSLPVLEGPNHDGGVLLLGPPGQFPGVGDGAALYTVIGDLNLNGQLQNYVTGAAPDDRGVIFRVQQNGVAAPGNPFTPYCSVTTAQTCVNTAGCPGGETCQTQVARYYAYGVRNSFGLGIDPVTGSLWDTENGPGTMDEVNRVVAGMNSGWEDLMGPDSLDPNSVADLFNMPGAGLTYSDPEFSFSDTNAPTAIVFPDGSSLGADYDDVALVADNNLGQIYAFPLNAARTGFALSGNLADLVADDQGQADVLRFAGSIGSVTDLEVGPDGDLYVVSFGNGTVYRITGGFADVDGDGVDDSVDNCPTVANTNQADGNGGAEVPPDGVGNVCDNCMSVDNPRVPGWTFALGSSAYRSANPWATLTGDQRDDDHDGYGNICDADFNQSNTTTAADTAQFKASIGDPKGGDICGTPAVRPCAIFDINATNSTESSASGIDAADTARYKVLLGRTPGPRCGACSGTGSVPLPCTAGTAGSCN